MNLTAEDKLSLIQTLQVDFRGKTDGGRKNLLLPYCPWCGHDKYKYGIYIGYSNGNKQFGSSHCFSCGRSARTLKKTLETLGREELMPAETEELEEDLSPELKLFEDEIDDELVEVTLPKGYKRVYKNRYLKSRGWNADDYDYFPVGTNRGMDYKYDDYVILPIMENGVAVGFVARHTWSKEEIEEYNLRHRKMILRYKNSTEENGTRFEKLIYNIDAVIPYVTDTVIVCEGAFDVVGLNRKLELYDNDRIKPVATFGKKISKVQLYKLQSKGVRTVIMGYDQDAAETTKRLAKELEEYFDVLIADIPQNWKNKDWDEMTSWQVYDVFANRLKTVREFNLTTDL